MLHKLTEIFAEYCREHLANERIKFMKKKLYRQSKETANGGEKWMQRRYDLLSVDLDDTYQNFFQRVRYREKSGLAHTLLAILNSEV